jgi:hypothetical protein
MKENISPRAIICDKNEPHKPLFSIVKVVNDDIDIMCGASENVRFHKDTPVQYIVDYLLWRCATYDTIELSVISNFEMRIPNFTKGSITLMEKIILFIKYCTKYQIEG